MSASHSDQICPICRVEDGGDVVKIRQKGADGINEASVRRGDTLAVTAGCIVHTKCRKLYTNSVEIDLHLKRKQGGESSTTTTKRSARVSEGPFNSQTDCLFCGTNVQKGSADYSHVKTEIFAKTILQCCESRCDEWSFKVKGRIEYYHGDLHAADCVYHNVCSSHFRCGRDVPLQFLTQPDPKRRKSGRPKDEDQEQAFSRMCAYLEMNDEEQLTVSDLRCKMKEYLSMADSLPYGNQYLKSQLKERYGNCIYIAEGEGLDDIVTMREKTSHILRSYFNSTKEKGDEESQKRAVLEAAARLIKSDIKTNVPTVKDQYPTTEELKLQAALDYIPESLRSVLTALFVGKDTQKKVASIGHAIIQAVRPRAVLAPLQIGLSVQMHHLNRSRFLVDTLCQMGFCSSYSEMQRFEMNAANCAAPNMLGQDIDALNMALLFAADNVDHNILTIDGKGTFHGMGMIATLTPGQRTDLCIPRHRTTELNIVEKSKVAIIDHRFARHVRREITFNELPDLTKCDTRVDVLWELSFNFKQATPGWQGMMHIIYQGNDHPGQSSIRYLPMIDMYSGDKTCILSTLEFLCRLAYKHHLDPVVTFDQPLYWKAQEIVLDSPPGSHLKSIVLLLGGFHTFMNLLGAIGTLMEGTGLKEILRTVYGDNSVAHMLTGKSVQRAFRGHLLVDRCLNRMMVSEMADGSPEFAAVVEESEGMYSALLNGEATLETVLTSENLSRIDEELEKRKTELSARSKTSQLWLNYQNMVKVARSLMKADRTGSWLMHLRAVSDCLPIFAAAGHYNYLKSAYFYVQEMGQLDIKHPDLFRKFEKGFHVIRRSNQLWAGLSSDLVIETTLMRSLKTTGGMTHGGGMSEEQRAIWTMSRPITSEYNIAMQEFTNLSYSTSEQHKDLTEARMKRDATDLEEISAKLVAWSPFSPDSSLRNVVTGVVADEGVNVHEYKSVGCKIMQKMIGQPAFTFSFSRKDKAITLGQTSAIKVAPDRTIDSALLFQRFLVVSQTGELSLEEVMRYELTPFPPALFEARNVFRKADKPQLAKAICDHAQDAIQDSVPETEYHVLDGGSLLHRIPWKNGESYGDIAQSYADFTIRHYGSATTVVFDGYDEGPSIKDNTHERRGQNIHPIVGFTAATEFTGKKEEFLSRDVNKQRLIQMISDELRKRDCTVVNALGDADVDIVKAAVEASRLHTTTLIGEDTDLLVLLLYYAQGDTMALYFKSDRTKPDGSFKVYDINRLKDILGHDLCSQLLFIHAMTGCDTTSRIFGVGKKSAFQKLVKGDPVLQSCANAFTIPNQTTQIIEDLGCQVMSFLFGGKHAHSLDTMRYNILCKKVVSSSSFVTPERLPPTESATKLHCRRVYYQIMVWMGMEEGMDPMKWGWKLLDNRFVPLMSRMNAAPDSLLQVIHCNCSTACKTLRCSCRRYGLPCTTVCGPCQLEECDNPHNKFLPEESDDEDEQ